MDKGDEFDKEKINFFIIMELVRVNTYRHLSNFI